ncbi:predicted protein [Chaetomium globosum CBS 148.51]|uniref:MARVEL domain-containing protein n=1 Tax=Chaetomium globosum (strain ATCC 6205 / CBS 148.51 / DSM 1962 / NBRC 6347 / NRRL 1970) TaxID=306901 RepID=Q2GTX3_CHAGB|nr:uncharacterized protein CHGG_08581 [Chaetomium globosum CBS 148.51]EAQ84567.1 predicted protein [Chaetomium globosum CBS 148.51]
MENLPPKYVSPPGTWRTKLGLRAGSVLCVIILAGLSGSLAANPRIEAGALLMVVLAPAIIVTFVWDVAEAACILKRGGNRGIHPGAIVAIDLLAWLGWAIVDLMLSTFGVISRPRYMIQDYSGYDNDRYQYDESKVTPEDRALETEIQGKGRAMIVFGVITT